MGDQYPLIVIISNTNDATADFFQRRLEMHQVSHVRLDTEYLLAEPVHFAIGDGRIVTRVSAGHKAVDVNKVTAIYYRRPVTPNTPAGASIGMRRWIANEVRSAWGGLLATNPSITWVNHPLAISGAAYKPEQLVRAARMGLNVPETVVTTDVACATDFCRTHSWNVVTKPIGHGEIRAAIEADDRVVYTSALNDSHERIMTRVAVCPTLLQRRITKDIDVRVTVVDSECMAVALHSQDSSVSAVDCRRDNMRDMRYSRLRLPTELEQSVIDYTKSYGLTFSAIDLVRDREGVYWFLEINPAGQWAWLEQVADVPISDALIRCLTHVH